MQALTIHQPYAHYIVTPASGLKDGMVRKRCENRTWYSGYRGPLLIHAGKSQERLTSMELHFYPEMVFGAIVGVATLVDVVDIRKKIEGKYRWLKRHYHAEGPFCWILENVHRCEPYHTNGRQGLWQFHEHSKLVFPTMEPKYGTPR